MRLFIVADIDIPDDTKQEANIDLLSFCEKHLKVYNLSNDSRLSLRTVVEDDCKILRNCDLPQNIMYALSKNNIKSLHELSNLTYKDIRTIQFKDNIGIINGCDCIEIINLTLRNYGFPLIEYDVSNSLPLESCKIPIKIHNALVRKGIRYIQDLSLFTKEDISKIYDIGVKMQLELEKIMKRYGVWYAEDRM